ncbi:2-hydroxyacyl-CoA dehydratase subunit D [Chloroflexota bacterium]
MLNYFCQAAGMLPWRITGTWQENVNRARVYRPESTCPYLTHALESFLSGELDFLDGIVVTDQDQDFLRLWDVLVYLKILPFCLALHAPFADSEINCQYFAGEIRRLISSLEDFGGVKTTDESLRASIDTYNQTRSILGRMYELRKREVPPLSGAEALGITTAAQVMPKEQFNQELEELLPYLEKRKTNLKQVHPRLLVSSDMLDNPAYLNLVEEGCLVAMDDMDTGIRYFTQAVDNTLKDREYALAKRYLNRHGAPRMTNWDRQVEQVIKWVKEFNIDGVLSLPFVSDFPQSFRRPFLSNKLEEAGIPSAYLEREYHLASAGQLRTRIGAFLEMLSVR